MTFFGISLTGGCTATAVDDFLFEDTSTITAKGQVFTPVALTGYIANDGSFVPLTAGEAPPGWSVSGTPTAVPEPTVLLLLLTGAAALAATRKRVLRTR